MPEGFRADRDRRRHLRPRGRDPPARGRHPVHEVLEKHGHRRRHLAREPLPGLPGWTPRATCTRSRSPRTTGRKYFALRDELHELPRGTSPTSFGVATRHPLRHRGHRRALRRGTRRSWVRRRRRPTAAETLTRQRRDQRGGRLQHAQVPGHPRPGRVRRAGRAHRALARATSTWPASGSPSSATARARCRSSRRSPARRRTSPSSSARRSGRRRSSSSTSRRPRARCARCSREVPLYRIWYRLRLGWTFNDRVHPALQKDPEWEHPERSVNRINDGHREFFTRYIESELGDRPDLMAKVAARTTRPSASGSCSTTAGTTRSSATTSTLVTTDRPIDVRDRDGCRQRRRARRARVRHGLRRRALPGADGHPRARRHRAARRLGRRGRPRLPRHDRPGLPEPADGLRAEHAGRPRRRR